MQSKRKGMYIIVFLVVCDCVLGLWLGYVKIQKKIPEEIYIIEKQRQEFSFFLPLRGRVQEESTQVICNQASSPHANIEFDFSEPFSLYAEEKGFCSLKLKLFGMIPIRSINVNVIEPGSVYAGGECIGIKIDTKGVLVLGLGKVQNEKGQMMDPARNRIKSGDYIEAINGKSIDNKEELIRELNELGKDKVVLKIKRKNESFEVCVDTVKCGKNQYKLGIWVRDDTQGIGTLTYWTKDGTFAALGHGINDVDTGTKMDVKGGYICKVSVYRIVKGTKGNPGELSGYLKKGTSDKLGQIQTNTSFGVIGHLDRTVSNRKEEYEVGLKQEIQTGKAYALCQIDNKVDRYEIQIEKVSVGSKEKGMVIRVTDKKLLQKTGGIVQGMSGSPIIQNGKLVGAITHVFVEDPTRGYGIFIEEMLGK